jgi:uncharacterized protein
MTDPTPAPAAQPNAPFTDAEDKQYATLATFLNIILIVPALIFYFAFASRGPKIGAQAKENLNWAITVFGAWLILIILGVALIFIGIGLIFTLLGYLVLIANLVFSIIGGVKVSNTGEFYKYPFALRLVK